MGAGFSKTRRFSDEQALTSNSSIRFLCLPPLSLLVKNIQNFTLRKCDFVGIVSGTGVYASASQQTRPKTVSCLKPYRHKELWPCKQHHPILDWDQGHRS